MKKACFLLMTLMMAPLMQGCPKHSGTVTETHEVNEWVYTKMKEKYLWAAELPAKDVSGLNLETQDYFDSKLRYRKNKSVKLDEDYLGDRFSRIEFKGDEGAETRARSTAGTFDFGFLLSRIISQDRSLHHLQVLYVIPGAPAEKAGLRRGDTFDEINGIRATNDNYLSLLANSGITLTVLNRENEDGEPVKITMEKSFYDNNPIILDTIYEEPARTAYMVYNHFTDGGSLAYATKLKDAFRRYKIAGVETLVLDLRYNGGGEISNAQLLASLIAPYDMLGKEFMRAESNTCIGRWDNYYSYKFLNNVASYNADIKNLYVITSGSTASASELIVHTLRPIFRDAGRNIQMVGNITRGKNVGSATYTNSKYEWEISPITMRVYNLDKESGYEYGLKLDAPPADLRASEYISSRFISEDYSPYYSLPPLGNYEHEALLNYTMSKYLSIPAAYNYNTMWKPQATRSADALEAIPMVPQPGLTTGRFVVD